MRAALKATIQCGFPPEIYINVASSWVWKLWGCKNEINGRNLNRPGNKNGFLPFYLTTDCVFVRCLNWDKQSTLALEKEGEWVANKWNHDNRSLAKAWWYIPFRNVNQQHWARAVRFEWLYTLKRAVPWIKPTLGADQDCSFIIMEEALFDQGMLLINIQTESLFERN